MMSLPDNWAKLGCRSNKMTDWRTGLSTADRAREVHRHFAIGNRRIDDANGRRQQKQQLP
jgi:hypothetical protein